MSRTKMEFITKTVATRPWVAAMERVVKHTDQIRQRNEPVLALNRALLVESRRTGRPVVLHPLPHRPERWARQLMDRETAVKRGLRARSPKEWERLVGELMPPLRNAVARIVWWDYFGDRVVSEAWPHLDKYIQCAHVEVPEEQLSMGLRQMGYSPWEAVRRVRGEGSEQE